MSSDLYKVYKFKGTGSKNLASTNNDLKNKAMIPKSGMKMLYTFAKLRPGDSMFFTGHYPFLDPELIIKDFCLLPLDKIIT